MGPNSPDLSAAVKQSEDSVGSDEGYAAICVKSANSESWRGMHLRNGYSLTNGPVFTYIGLFSRSVVLWSRSYELKSAL